MDQEKCDKFICLLEEALEISKGSLSDEKYEKDFVWDSLAILSTIANIDSLFDIVISPDDLNKCIDLRSVLDLIDTNS